MNPKRFLVDTTQAENCPDVLKQVLPYKTGAHQHQLDLIEYEVPFDTILAMLREKRKQGVNMQYVNLATPIGINLNTLPKGTTITVQGDYE